MLSTLSRCLLFFGLGLMGLGLVQAEPKPCALFSDHVVLQAGMDNPIWGTAREGEPITVTYAGQSVSTVTVNGSWRVRLPAPAPGPPQDLTIRGETTVVVHDVIVGEVWLCSGQSNMARLLVPPELVQPRLPSWEEEAARADHPEIRHFRVGGGVADSPKAEVSGAWEVCTPATARSFSAVGYFFARDLLAARHTPVGLINASVGATGIASWMSREQLSAHRAGQSILERQERQQAEYPAKREQYERDESRLQAEYQEALAKAKGAGAPEPRPPAPPGNPVTDAYRPTGNFNAKIAPLQPCALRGVLWYQGEANAGHAGEYRVLLPDLIEGWRAGWQQPSLLFLVVQLPPYEKSTPEIREAQLLTAQKTPRVGLIQTMDIGDPSNIHPGDKRQVGARLALAARALAYGEEVEYSGPLWRETKVDGNKAVLFFAHADDGLRTAGPKLEGFVVAGADRKFHAAEAEIVGSTVVVSSPEVAAPVNVRYNWEAVPKGTLTNAKGLPASSFRTDLP